MKKILFLIGSSVLGLMLVSCSIEQEFVKIWGDSINPPRFLSLELISEDTILTTFSNSISVLKASVIISGECEAGEDQYIPIEWDFFEDDSTKIIYTLPKRLKIAQKARLSAMVSDENGNSLSMIIPFVGYNFNPAKLQINELRVSYSKPKVEFIEFLVLESGNLGGLELGNYANTTKPFWEFPSCEVEVGELIVLHLRSIEDGLVNEIKNRDESLGTEALPDARDFWDDQVRAPLKGTNVITLRDRKGGPLQDALLCSEDLEDWPTYELKQAAQQVVDEGFWFPDAYIENAFITSGMTPTRTAGRNPDLEIEADLEYSKNNWRICATSKASPGKTNVAW